jgi:site-specific DNA-cytosine methylase
MPKMLELFCGTKSMSGAFEALGWETYTVDWEESLDPTLCADIGVLTCEDLINLCGGVPDVVWMSPDCTTYSVAAIKHHRKREDNGELTPTSPYAI